VKEFVLIRYGELGLKGGNRSFFEKTLQKNLKRARRGLADCPIHRLQGRFLAGPLEGPAAPLMAAFARVFGVTSLSLARRTAPDLETMKEAARQVTTVWLEEHPAPARVPFKARARRADKSFPLPSMEVARVLGGDLAARFPRLEVRMEEPELTVEIDIRPEGAFLCADRLPGPGGLPVGTQGRALLLLSGGIDSPVAGWLALKRGVRLQGVHFESRPYTSLQARQKVEDLARILAGWGHGLRLHLVPFTPIQEAIHAACAPRYQTILHRRAMHRLAQEVARREEARALVTGESLGQVASQTLENLGLTDEVLELPLLRPLVTFDKEETIALAERIGTYPVSVRPYQDCCTIFNPRRPIIRGRIPDARREEGKYPQEELLAEALDRVESIDY